MENRKRNVQIIVRVTEDERTLIEERMRQIPTMNLSAYSRKMLIDRYIIVLERNLRRRKDSLHKRNGALRNWTGYSSVFTKITPTGNFLTADFKCSLTITNRSRKNCGKSCCDCMKKLPNRKNNPRTLTGSSAKYGNILTWKN